MFIHEALEKHLKTQQSVKVFSNSAPEKTPCPYIVYTKYSTQYSHTMGADSGYNDSYFQVDIYAKDAKNSLTLAKTIRKSLMNFTGIMGGTGGVDIQCVEIENDTDSFESGVNFHRVMQEYKITYIEEV